MEKYKILNNFIISLLITVMLVSCKNDKTPIVKKTLQKGIVKTIEKDKSIYKKEGVGIFEGHIKGSTFKLPIGNEIKFFKISNTEKYVKLKYREFSSTIDGTEDGFINNYNKQSKEFIKIFKNKYSTFQPINDSIKLFLGSYIDDKDSDYDYMGGHNNTETNFIIKDSLRVIYISSIVRTSKLELSSGTVMAYVYQNFEICYFLKKDFEEIILGFRKKIKEEITRNNKKRIKEKNILKNNIDNI